MVEILRLRFDARNGAFQDELTAIKSEMAARGVLNSGTTIKRGHEALVAEFEVSRETIVTTYTENLYFNKPRKVPGDLIDQAISTLNERRDFLNRFYIENMAPVRNSLQNRAALEPYSNLASVSELNQNELKIRLGREIDEYISSRGETLFHRVKNEFLNRPLIVLRVITFSVVLAILTFVSTIQDL